MAKQTALMQIPSLVLERIKAVMAAYSDGKHDGEPPKMKAKDWALLVVLMTVLAVVTFTDLGHREAPVSAWWPEAGEAAVIAFDEVTDVAAFQFFNGHDNNRAFMVNISLNNAQWETVYVSGRDYSVFQWVRLNFPQGYMGCRSRALSNVNGPEITDGRGNLSFASVNLPRIGIRSKGDMTLFFTLLYSAVTDAIQVLLTRYEVQKKMKARDFPFLMGQKLYQDSDELEPSESIEKAIRHGTLSVGFIGLAECLKALCGAHHGESPEAQQHGLEIVTRMRQLCDAASTKHKLNITLLATPAEQLAGKFLQMDKEKYGTICGITDKEWYTNSFHVPVEYSIAISEKIAVEGPYHALCNAGHISYVELATPPGDNIEAFESIIRAMADAGMGYGAVNFPVDICMVCGTGGLLGMDTCPKCGESKISRVRRITGYLSTLDRFNESKSAEAEARKVHGSGKRSALTICQVKI